MVDSQTEFNRFIKMFSTRLVQTVVQSRLGRPIDTPCTKPNDEVKDWFSFKIDELGEVAAYITQSLKQFPPAIECFTLEFILYTASGDYLPLEEWQVSVDKDEKDETVLMSNLYHQIGILLRSAAVASRMTPLFRYYVRKQSAESFVVLYRIIDTVGPSAHLEDEYITRNLGRLPSPYGTLDVQLAFKEKVVAEPKKSESPDMKPSVPLSRPQSYSEAIPVEGKEKVEASSPVADHLRIFRGSPATPASTCAPSTSSEPRKMDDSMCSSSDEEGITFNVPCLCHHGSGISLPAMTETATTSRPRHSSFPFAILLSSSKCKCSMEKMNSPPLEPVLTESVVEVEKKEVERSKRCCSDSESDSSSDDESVMNDTLENAQIFSLSSSSSQPPLGTNLGDFIAQCRLAPSQNIDGYHEDPNLIKETLESFEKNVHNFDEFVKEVDERVEHD